MRPDRESVFPTPPRAQQRLHFGAPDDDRYRQDEDDPELTSEGVGIMAGVLDVSRLAAMRAALHRYLMLPSCWGLTVCV